MKILYVFFIIISIILSPLFSFPDKDAIPEKPQNKLKSKITVTGTATITIINNKSSNYGPKVEKIILINGGKVNNVITKESELLETNSNEFDGNFTKASTIDIPIEFIIGKVYPNPFNPAVKIQYGLPDETAVSIAIHDIQGRLINKFSTNIQSAGWHEYIWNGIDYNGQNVGTGVYLFTIQVGNLIKKQKITFLK